MNVKRYQERCVSFRDAFAALKEALAQPKNSFIRDSVIQRFEFTYELGWKAMKLWLEGKEIDVRNARDTLKEALEQGLIRDGNGWSELHRARNLTSHTYDVALAEQVYEIIANRAVPLFEALDAAFRA